MSALPTYDTPLRAERGGLAAPLALPRMSVSATRALHIDPRILAQPGLSLTACALLAEVLDLYQVRGQVFANDAHFAARCRCSERTVRSTIAELEEGGYLERDVNARRSTKRLLVPTEKWQNLPEVPAEFAGRTPEVPANSATTPGENCQDSRQNLPRVPANSANINTSLNTKGNTKPKPDDAACAAAPVEVVEAVEVLDSSLEAQPAAASHTKGAEKHSNVSMLGDGQEGQDCGQTDKPASPKSARSRGKKDKAEEPEHFAAFWQAYTRHDNHDKAVAAFARLSAEDQAAAPARAAAWLARRTDWIGHDGSDYRPYAATWLNNKRWKELGETLPTALPAPTHAAILKPGAARHHVPAVESYGQL